MRELVRRYINYPFIDFHPEVHSVHILSSPFYDMHRRGGVEAFKSHTYYSACNFTAPLWKSPHIG